MFHTIDEAIDDLKKGKVVIVCDDEDRENEGDFVAIAEYATPETVNFMATEGRGLVCTPMSKELAEKLELPPMARNNTDKMATAFTVSIDHKETATGISAFERAFTIREMLKEEARPEAFSRPGHVFPLVAMDGGALERAGHTEAAVDLAKLAGAKPAGVICEIMNDDGTMARVPDLEKIAEKFDIKMITIEQLIQYRQREASQVSRKAAVQLPTAFGDFKAIVYANAEETEEAVALVKGNLSPEAPVLVRVHSECLTGDVFGSCRCDCGPQLHEALRQIDEAGSGVLLYMRQEGRGIGLINKLKAYELQEQGYDTVEANHQLGFKADLRDYSTAAQIIEDIGIQHVKLLTNNPRKIAGLEKHGLHVVERVPLQMPAQKENTYYLETKKSKLGHLLTL